MNNIRFSTADGTEKTIKDAGCTINVGQVQGGEEVETNGSIYIEDIEVKAGEAFEIPVMFRNELAYSAFQCDINLPQGIEIEVDEYGEYCVYPESSRLTNTHTLAASKVQDGVIRVACYSTASRDIRGNDGALFHIKAKAEDGCEGDLKLTMNNIRFSTADGTERIIRDIEGVVTIVPVTKYYTITYMVDGEEYAVDSVAYGTKIALREEPTKEGYTFSGWSEAPETMPANDIVVEGTFSVNYYAITYMVDGETYAVDSVAYGTKIALRDDPTKEGHTFSGWSKVPETMPANDIVVEGTFSVNYYSITYIVDGETYAVDSVAYGTKIALRDAPTKEGHTFIGWSKVPETMPANDIVVGGTFSVNYYAITYNVDGEEYAVDSVAYGTKIELRDEPTKEGYTFSGWSDAPETMPAYDIVVGGTFSVNSYTITYKVDGEEYAVDSVAYGTKIALRDEPTKEGHTFSGWSKVPETMPAYDIVVEGTFSVNYYSITYIVDGEEYAVDSVAYGTKIELRDEPAKEGHAFSGWSDAPETMPANDIVIEGNFIENGYKIIYKIDGEVYKTEVIAYGSAINLIEEPTKEGHTFSGWSEVPETMPANDIVVEGTFYVNYYAITYNVDGEEYAVDSVAYGTKIELRDEPTKEGHTFSGWSKVPETMPANDIVVEGTFSVNSYTITYKVDGKVYKTATLEYGAVIEAIEEPTKEGHTFSGWSETPETMPANDIVIEGTFYVNYYAITYIVDGETYAVDSVAYGTKIELRDEPTKEGHTFSGWSETPETMPANDIVIEGTFYVNYYAITYIVDGETYAVDSVAYGTKIELRDEPTKEGYTFSGWKCEYTTMPAMDIFVYGTFTATGISAIVADDFVDVYTLNGVMIKSHIAVEMLEKELSSGVYIINGKKVYIRQQ